MARVVSSRIFPSFSKVKTEMRRLKEREMENEVDRYNAESEGAPVGIASLLFLLWLEWDEIVKTKWKRRRRGRGRGKG